MIKLGILGCGAITRGRHIVSALAHPDVELVALVDADVNRAAALQDQHGLNCKAVGDYHDILGQVDAVINALPNFLHAPVNREFLEAGVHVLSEKPLAISATDARSCAEAAAKKGVILAVGMPFRLRESSQILPILLENHELGNLQTYAWDYGMPFEWPAASTYFLSRAHAGGGVLLDEGVHLLDCLLNWFGEVVEYHCETDDWGGGIEANAVLQLRHRRNGHEVEGYVRLSRTYTLKNCLRVDGDRAYVEILRSNPDALVLTRKVDGHPIAASLSFPQEKGRPAGNPFFAELDDFVQAIQKRQAPLVDGWQALQTIELIEKCYATAARIPEPWTATVGRGELL